MDKSELYMEQYISSVKNKQSIVGLLDYNAKKEVLYRMFEKIVWDSDSNNIYIEKKNRVKLY